MKHLCDEDRRHGHVDSGPVHVDVGADGKNEPGDPGVDTILLLQTFHGDGEGGSTGRCAPGCHDGLTLVSNEPERHFQFNFKLTINTGADGW